ncbi:hypothetical protein IX39_00650 [Chryseobacterium formosense]|uniref:Alpha/beta hydrolase n=1 Tax=Chryseobacterium formosense TaxID=236814 RepID=A0A085Z460_9FLAO|nr:hypothetical protein [Chryseobacterium formosense]KFE99223.1 hypothetical protein IX39_00650 [Chryseobacterium formosense]SFT92291.1 hypothetical protein SAMN05421857_4134 [Chryseobacterium formosense]
MKYKLLIILFIAFFSNAFAQEAEKVTFKDSKNFYYRIVPEGKPQGMIVVLPGGGENAERVMNQIYLDELAYAKDMLVLFTNWEEDGDFFYNADQKFLDRIVKDNVEKYGIPKNKISIGGLSGGGMLAITYAERAVRDKNTYFVPSSVFAIDPPLDYENMYYRLERDIERNFSDAAVNEAKMFNKELVAAIGTPDKNRDKYLKESMFTYRDKDGGNAKYLMNIPILMYTEAGIMWQMKNRGRNIYDLNCADITAMMNLLKLRGHKNADLIITNDRGIRPEGFRHPHSWSIMDSEECLNWILKHFN